MGKNLDELLREIEKLDPSDREELLRKLEERKEKDGSTERGEYQIKPRYWVIKTDQS